MSLLAELRDNWDRILAILLVVLIAPG